MNDKFAVYEWNREQWGLFMLFGDDYRCILPLMDGEVIRNALTDRERLVGLAGELNSAWEHHVANGWIKAADKKPNHQQDCIVISDNGAVRRAIFWKTPEDFAGIWYLDAFHKVMILGVVLWMPFPEDELNPPGIPDYATTFPVNVECPKGCVKHRYPLGCSSRVAHFCEFCGSPLERIKKIGVT